MNRRNVLVALFGIGPLASIRLFAKDQGNGKGKGKGKGLIDWTNQQGASAASA